MLYEARLRGDASPLPEVAALQYGDYAVWQRNLLRPDRPAYRAAVSWWKHNLSGASRALKLPSRGSGKGQTSRLRTASIFWGVERQISYRLNALGPAQSATRSMVRLAAFAALLAAETGEPDVYHWHVCRQRNRLPLQNMFGYFSNLVTLRFRCRSDKIVCPNGCRSCVVRCWAPKPTAKFRTTHCAMSCARGRSWPDIKVIFHVSGHQWTTEFADIRADLE